MLPFHQVEARREPFQLTSTMRPRETREYVNEWKLSRGQVTLTAVTSTCPPWWPADTPSSASSVTCTQAPTRPEQPGLFNR